MLKMGQLLKIKSSCRLKNQRQQQLVLMTKLLLLCHCPEEFDQKSFLLTFYLSSLRLLAGYQNRVNLLGVHALGKWASCLVHMCTVHVS